MTRTIEEIRLDVLRLAVTSRPDGDALDWAAQAMHLVEHGPTIEEEADQADGTAATEAFSAALDAWAEPPRETVAQAIKAGREDAHVPPRLSPIAEAIIATNRAAHAEAAEAPPTTSAGPMWSEERKRLVVSTVYQWRNEGARPNYNQLATRVNALPGPQVTSAQVVSCWNNHKGNAAYRSAEAPPAEAPPAEAPFAEEPAPAPAEPPQATPEPVVRQWCARWLPAQRLSDPITEAELARVDAERRRRGLTPFTRIKELA